MSSFLLRTVDYLLFSIHILVILTNMFGWIFRQTRKLQLITVAFTALSWFALGIWFGWGYCFLTDWEWDIKRMLGEYGLPNSFIHYLSNNILGLDLDPGFLDDLTLLIFLVAIVACIWVNFPARKRGIK